jgi:predicted nucleic acid-binding protein
MRVVDSSAFIEWLLGSPTGAALASEMPMREDWIVPTIVQLELAKWLHREGRLDETEDTLAFTQLCRIQPLNTKLALAAAELCVLRRLSTADAIVYATALEYGAELLTCDAHFGGLPGVVYVAKA